MLVLVTYDVAMSDQGARRLRRVAKVCTNYGQRVQNSVFECMLTRAQWTTVKHLLSEIIDDEQDSIRVYFMGDSWERNIVQMGKNTSYNPTGELIL